MVVFALGVAETDDARPHGLPVQVDGAGAAQRHPAPELGAGQRELVAQVPQQRRGRIAVKRAIRAIDTQSNHWEPLLARIIALP